MKKLLDLFEELKEKKILITGATGLIGSNLVKRLISYNKKYSLNIKIIAMVRDINKANKMFGECLEYDVEFLLADILNEIEYNQGVDYIIHAASQTASKLFIDRPVDTIRTSVIGTLNVLEFAKRKEVKGFVYLSTMEVYGTPHDDTKITEDHVSNVDFLDVRSSYPGSKSLCENLCVSFWHQYELPSKIIRLTQTFGSGVSYNDNRVFAEFARSVVEGRDIVLHTSGDTKRSYLDVEDAVNAILLVLINGENGQSYNVANESTYCSIYEMASMVARVFCKNAIDVKVICEDHNKYGYAPSLRMNLDTKKIQYLGWRPKYDLIQMYNKMIGDFRQQKGIMHGKDE